MPSITDFQLGRHWQNEQGAAISRRNSLFIGSDSGGDRTVIFYTLIESAKLNGLDPEAYMHAVIYRAAEGYTDKALDALLA